MAQHQQYVKKTKQFLKHHAVSLGLLAFVLMLSVLAIDPMDVMADEVPHPTKAETQATTLMIAAMQNTYVDYGTLPVADERGVPEIMQVPLTAYSSTPDQCDDTPFITASGTHVRDGVIAANFLPIGTRVKIPELYGDKIFVVEDRMNKRYWKKIDIWMAERADAKQFGVKTATVEIYR